MIQINRDSKGRIVPPGPLFGIDYGCEVDDYLTPQSDEKYAQMAEESEKIVRETLKLSGFKSWDAFVFSYKIEKTRDKLQDIAQERKYGRNRVQEADKLLEEFINHLKTVRNGYYSWERWKQKVIKILNSFRMERNKRWNLIMEYS